MRALTTTPALRVESLEKVYGDGTAAATQMEERPRRMSRSVPATA